MHKETRVCRQGPAHTLLLSPGSTRGREVSLKFSHLSWITLNPFNSLFPLVPGNNLRVSHSWPAPPGSLGFYHPTPTKWHPNVSFQSIQHHGDAQTVRPAPCCCTSNTYFSARRAQVGDAGLHLHQGSHRTCTWEDDREEQHSRQPRKADRQTR